MAKKKQEDAVNDARDAALDKALGDIARHCLPCSILLGWGTPCYR